MALKDLPRSESRKLYSWWWDSHISPKNSKWFRDNLADMDLKIKSMIKLIEEDADTFSRRAELYFQKRPELIELVEEFYRAYRALAERYDCASVELRQAHGPTTELLVATEFNNFTHLSPGEASVFHEIFEKIQAEKENVALSFHENLQRLFALEREIADTGGFDEQASRTEVEIKVLEDTMKKLMSERDENLEKLTNCTGDEKETWFLKYNKRLEMVAILEELIRVLGHNNGQGEDHEEELESLVLKIKEKDEELGQKESKLTEIQKSLTEERLKASTAESSLADLKNLHSKFVQEQDTITTDLKMKIQYLTDLKSLLEVAIGDLKEEIFNLNEAKPRLERGQNGEKSEKETLLWQIQMMLDNLQRLSEKNALAENALVRANVENENLRSKTAALEESCEILKDEKIAFLNEKNSLGLRMGNLESQFLQLEEKCSDKGAGNDINKAVDAEIEIKVLKKFVEDLEQKNIALMFECQKHVESAKLTKKIMVEYEDDSIEQQAEIECLLDEIEKLRTGFRKIFKALNLNSNEGIESLAHSLQNNEDERHMLETQNLVFLAFLDQRNEKMQKEFADLRLKSDKLYHRNLTLRRSMSALLGFTLTEEDSGSDVDLLLYRVSEKVMKQQMEIEYLSRSNQEMGAQVKEQKLNEEKYLAEIQACAVRETLLTNTVDELNVKVALLENKIELSRSQNLTDEDIFPPTPGFTDRFQVVLQNSGRIEHPNDLESAVSWGNMKVNESTNIPFDEPSECSSIDSQRWRPSRKRNVVILSKSGSKKNFSRNGRSKRWNGIPDLSMDRFQVLRANSEEARAEFQDKTILERLESDAKRLISSELVVQELTKKLEVKSKVKQLKKGELEMIKRLMGAEEAILQLFSSTNQLAREIQTIQPKESDGAGDYGREGVAERAMKGSEMVGCLQFEVENIQKNIVSLLGGKRGKATTLLRRGNIFKKYKNADERNWDNSCLCGYGRHPTPADLSGRFVL